MISYLEEIKSWRHCLHQHPEPGFEEKNTAAFVASKLRSFGLDQVVEGIGGTGVVGVLKSGNSTHSIALRADMDALLLNEDRADLAYASVNNGLKHGCGHDGHTAMLLGAAKTLALEKNFNGTVYFVFQPAEEWGCGAVKMIEDGLFQRFPIEEIYGIHNMPLLDIDTFTTSGGPVMSAEDNFEIILHGIGGHSSRPEAGREVMVAACALVLSLQTAISRRVSPMDNAVLSVTNLTSDGTRNVLPSTCHIYGDVRSFREEVSQLIEREIFTMANGISSAYGITAEIKYTHDFKPTVNDEVLSSEALSAAKDVYGLESVSRLEVPYAASEDFAQYLTHVPGCFAFIGNGRDSYPLHHPRYDFADEALIKGSKYFVAITRQRLSLPRSD